MSDTDPVVTETAPAHADAIRRLANAMLRYGLPSVVVACVIAVVLAAVIVGSAGLAGAAVGAGIGIVLGLITVGFMRFSAGLPPMVGMAVAMGSFVLKLVLALIAAVALKGVAGLHMYSLALTLLTSIFVWAGADVVAFRRTHIPTISV